MNVVWQAYLRVIIRRIRAQGHSWQEIGEILGISRQAAHERFSPHEHEDMPQEMDFWFDLIKQSYPRRDG